MSRSSGGFISGAFCGLSGRGSGIGREGEGFYAAGAAGRRAPRAEAGEGLSVRSDVSVAALRGQEAVRADKDDGSGGGAGVSGVAAVSRGVWPVGPRGGLRAVGPRGVGPQVAAERPDISAEGWEVEAERPPARAPPVGEPPGAAPQRDVPDPQVALGEGEGPAAHWTPGCDAG